MNTDRRRLTANVRPTGANPVREIAAVPAVTLLNSGRANGIQCALHGRLMQRDASSGMPAAAPVVCACPAELQPQKLQHCRTTLLDLPLRIDMSADRKTREAAKRPLSEERIRGLVTAESFARGGDYFDDGAVSDLLRRGDRLTAEVEGSEFEPHQVSIRLHDRGVADAHCTCPYDWGGYCKHIVAVLLKLADEKTRVIERKPIAEISAGWIKRD